MGRGLVEKPLSSGGEDKLWGKGAPKDDQEAIKAMRATLSRCRSIEYFASMILTRKVSELRDGVFYKSKVINAVLYDARVVSHDQKIEYMFQVTDQRQNDHAIKPAALVGVLKGLNMMPGMGEADEEYTITYVLVRPTASECVYMDSIEGAVEKKRKKDGEVDLADFKEQMEDTEGRVTCCISAAIAFGDLQSRPT